MNVQTYMGTEIEPRIGDVVMVESMRGIVIAVNGTMLTVLGIGTSKDTGETFVLPQRYVSEYPVGRCHYMEKQTLSL